MVDLKETIPWLLEEMLGRPLYGRVSRYLWRKAQLDAYDNFEENGESLLQRGLVENADRGRPLTVLDVGANIGEWAGGLIGQVDRCGGPPLELHLFEPSVDAAAELRERFGGGEALRRVDLKVHELAVADEPGTAELARTAPTAGTNSLKVDPSDEIEDMRTVEVTTLDAFCEREGIDRVDFVKIDTEGNDLNVLRGASELLGREAIDLMQFEYNQRWINFRYYLRDAFEYLDELGYRVGKVTNRGIETYRRWHLEMENFWLANFVAYRPSLDLPVGSFSYWKEV